MQLRAKIILSSGLPLLVAALAAIALLLTVLYRAQIDNTTVHLEDIATKVAHEIGEANSRATEAAEILAVSQTAGLFGDRERSIDLARAILIRFPNLTGAYFGYEPNADGQDTKALSSGVHASATDASGRFLPYWFRDSQQQGQPGLKPLVDMDTSYYYRGIRNFVLEKPEHEGIKLEGGISAYIAESNRGYSANTRHIVTEPYLYEGKFIVEYTAPIIIDNIFAGIAGVDRSLNDIDAFLSSLRTYESEEYILLSGRGRIISATNAPELRGMLVENSPYLSLARSIWSKDGRKTGWQAIDSQSGESRLLAAERVTVGNWTLIVSVTREELLRDFWSVFIQVALIATVGSLIALLISIRLIAKPIARVESAAEIASVIASGDLTHEIDSSSDDESGVLLKALKDMSTSLAALISEVRGASERISDVSDSISRASSNQQRVNLQLADSSSNIATSVEQISSTSEKLLHTMEKVTSSTTEATKIANYGHTELAQMCDTILDFSQAAGSISSKLEVISERANSIGTIVTTINRVADQTNLLSLNAAIEAEKAGENGQGFSVVAREIRRLADQTALATFDIEQIVEDMQSSVANGVVEMGRFSDQVNNGVEESRRVSEHLQTVIHQVEALRPSLQLAANQVQAQATEAREIGMAMQQLGTVAEASDLSSQVLDAAVLEFAKSVSSLKQSIDNFKVS
jgi:methyl-accepting chemotaxis protein